VLVGSEGVAGREPQSGDLKELGRVREVDALGGEVGRPADGVQQPAGLDLG
jgi:hypothetical protein